MFVEFEILESNLDSSFPSNCCLNLNFKFFHSTLNDRVLRIVQEFGQSRDKIFLFGFLNSEKSIYYEIVSMIVNNS